MQKSIVVTDKFRTAENIISSSNLLEFLEKGRVSLGLNKHEEVYAVLEDDGKEVDEEEYFLLLPDDTVLMILSSEQLWSPTISFKGSCIFDSASNIFTSAQLAVAIMEHIKRVTQEAQEEESSPCKKKEGDDLPVSFVTQNTDTTAF